MKNAGIIIKKELNRVFGDKKLIFSLFLLPAVMVIGIYSLIGQLAGSMSKDIETHIPVVYLQNAPADFSTILDQRGYREMADIRELASDASEASIQEIKDGILDGSIELMVSFDPQFSEKVAAYQSQGDAIPDVTVYYNTTGNYSTAARSTFGNVVMSAYQTLLLQNRLGNLEMLNVYTEQEVIIVNEDKASGQYLSTMLPYLITFLLFASAMSLCVDAIAGEKERGTMASLLLTPIKRSNLVFGKLVSLSILSSISALVYAVSIIVAMPMMMNSVGEAGAATGMGVTLSVFQIASMILILVTLVYLYVALISLVSVIAKTVKEASTYVTPLYIIVLLAGMITMFQGGTDRSDFLHAIPVYGSALSIQNIMTNELTALQLGYSLCGNLLLALILTLAVTKAFNSEKIMFNA